MMYVAAVSLLSSSPLSLITAISFFQSCLVCAVPQKSHCFPMPQWRWGGVGWEWGEETPGFFSPPSFCGPESASFTSTISSHLLLLFLSFSGVEGTELCLFGHVSYIFFLTTQHGGHHGGEVTERGLDSQHCRAHKEVLWICVCLFHAHSLQES